MTKPTTRIAVPTSTPGTGPSSGAVSGGHRPKPASAIGA